MKITTPMRNSGKTTFVEKYGEGPHTATDLAVITQDAQILLIKRKDNGMWALPGGMIEPGEWPYDAARREIKEEAGVVITQEPFFCHTATDPKRDGRGHIMSFVFACHVKTNAVDIPITAMDDAKEAQWFPFARAMELNLFSDHNKSLKFIFEKMERDVLAAKVVKKTKIANIFFGGSIILGMFGFYLLGLSA